MLVLTLNPVTSEADHSPHQLKLTILTPDARLHPWLEKTKRDQKQGIKPGQKVLRDGPHTVECSQHQTCCLVAQRTSSVASSAAVHLYIMMLFYTYEAPRDGMSSSPLWRHQNPAQALSLHPGTEGELLCLATLN